MEQTFKKIVNEDVQTAARQISLPTLLVYGANDKTTPVSDGQKLSQAITRSKLEVVQTSHFLHQEQPEAVAQLMEDFLNA